MCVFIYTQAILWPQKLLFWMRLITINRLTALIENNYIHSYTYSEFDGNVLILFTWWLLFFIIIIIFTACVKMWFAHKMFPELIKFASAQTFMLASACWATAIEMNAAVMLTDSFFLLHPQPNLICFHWVVFCSRDFSSHGFPWAPELSLCSAEILLHILVLNDIPLSQIPAWLFGLALDQPFSEVWSGAMFVKMALSRISVAVPALSSAIDQIVYSLNSHITSVCLIKTGLWLNVEQMMSVDEAKSIQIFTRILSYRMLGQIGLAWIRIFMFLPHIQWGGGGDKFDPLLILYICQTDKKKDQSIILMLGLFEQWETECFFFSEKHI